MEEAVAMVLAGGRGKRMDILCQVRPKPALPFGGRFKVFDFSLSNCVHSQIRDIGVLTDYKRSHMAKYLQSWSLNNPGAGEFRVLEPRAGSYKGTADAVYQNLDYLKEANPNKVLILAGDHVYKMDYRQILSFHENAKADVTVGVIPVPIEEAHRFGIVTVDSEGRVVNFVEKPRHPQSNLVSMGVYVFNKGILCERLIEDAAWPDSPHDFGFAIIPGMVRRDRVFAYKFNDYWRDIGNAAAFYEANMEITGQQARFSLDGKWTILSTEYTGNVVNCMISPGCVVKGLVENSILSPGVLIESEAVVKDSILMPDVTVGHRSIVYSSILDEQVNIGKYCFIGFKDGPISKGLNITILGKGAVVPPHTVIGRDCKVVPGAEPSDFKRGMIFPGSTVTKLSESGCSGKCRN